jgi:hypothetical protein
MDFDPAGLGSTLRAGSDGAIGRLVRTVALSFVGPDRRTRALVVVLSCIHCLFFHIENIFTLRGDLCRVSDERGSVNHAKFCWIIHTTSTQTSMNPPAQPEKDTSVVPSPPQLSGNSEAVKDANSKLKNMAESSHSAFTLQLQCKAKIISQKLTQNKL